MSQPLDLARALDVARRAVAAGGRAALPFFRSGLVAEAKPDRSPVTLADRAAEAAMLSVLRWHFPRHAILSEESGLHGRESAHELMWVVDPLDGTYAFLRGSRVWGPLVALMVDGEPTVGALGLPALGETYWAARGHGCWRDGQRLRVSGGTDWNQAVLALGSVGPLLSGPYGAGVARLMRTSRRTYAPGDLGGAAMVLGGQAEVWLETGVALWDLAAHAALVTEAGGTWTDLSGGRDLSTGGILLSNGRLHSHVLAALATTTGASA